MKKFFRFHLLTLVLVNFAAAGLVWVNLQKAPLVWPNLQTEAFDVSTTHGFFKGWPYPMLLDGMEFKINYVSSDSKIKMNGNGRISPTWLWDGLYKNIGIGFLILAAVGFVSEYFLRRRAKKSAGAG